MLRGYYGDEDLTCLQLCERISIYLEDGDQPHEGGGVLRGKGSGMVLQQARFLLARWVLLMEEMSGPEGLRPTHSYDCKVLQESLALTCAGMRKGHSRWFALLDEEEPLGRGARNK